MIIGLSGKRGSGKNTVADIIQMMHPQKHFQVKAFADPLKQITAQLTGLPLEQMYTQEGKQQYMPEWGMTVGTFQQKLGTDAIRDGLHQNAWILAAFAGLTPEQNVIFCDMRFPNEAEAVKAAGGLLLRIEGDPEGQRGDGTRNDQHPSETALDGYKGFDAIIHNIGTLSDLYIQVEAVI